MSQPFYISTVGFTKNRKVESSFRRW